MEPLVLTDKSVVPNDDQIFGIIGENRIHWQRLMQSVRENYPDAQDVWRYYNDGNNWLFRIIRKKKTLFWIGILKDTFRITYYFGDKAISLIERSDLPELMKMEFKSGKYYGKIRAITIKVSQPADIDNAIMLAAIKVLV